MSASTRRTFIRQAACAALTTSGILNTIFDLRRLSAMTVPNGNDYRALICLFLYGGNDANNVIIPRGVFYDSKLYGKLSGTFSGVDNGPLEDATVYGNSNTLSSNLNSRVIQMVIAKNLTLAQAWGILWTPPWSPSLSE